MSSNHNGESFFLGLLTVAFIVLKLTGVIAWSWWWVLSPIWIPTAIVLVIAVIFCVVVGIQESRKKRKLAEARKRLTSTH